MKPFVFKQFAVAHDKCGMKVGTDGVVLGAWALSAGHSILDIGTGSGLLALMIAQRNSDAFIDAVEISKDAAQQAKSNFENSPWSHRLKIHHQDIREFKSEKTFDNILSNPPYFVNSTPPPLKDRLLARHSESLEPTTLLKLVKNNLSENGIFNIILPIKEGNVFIDKAANFQLFPCRICHFKPSLAKPPERLLITFSKRKEKPLIEELAHYNEAGQWSDEYKNLTRDFYIVL